MKTISFFTVALLFLLFSCKKEVIPIVDSDSKNEIGFSVPGVPFDGGFTPKNLCIFDERVRSIDGIFYVVELVLLDFDRTGILGNKIGVNDGLLADDGLGFDLTSGDGVYTTIKTYNHDAIVPFKGLGISRSVQETAIVNTGFHKTIELTGYAKTYQYRAVELTKGVTPELISVTCDMAIGGCFCYACRWGWCNNCCVTLSNCKVTLGVK